jgi:2-pyrone-4,6-dicarboxylate lactonase
MVKTCPGPIPVKPPRLKVPAKACDAHIHVVGPFDRYPMVPQFDFTCPEATAPMMRDFLGVLGIQRAVIVHITFSGTDPQITLEAIAGMEGDARGVIILDLETPDVEMERLTEGGIRGARLTPLFGEEISAKSFTTLANKIVPYGWHIQYMPADPDQWLALAPLLRALPVDVVIDHMAWRTWKVGEGLDQPGFKALRDLMESGKVWVKLGGMYRCSREPAPWPHTFAFGRALVETNPDRVVWGSDWPHVRMWNTPMPEDDAILDWLGELDLDDAAIAKILVDNPAALYGFD